MSHADAERSLELLLEHGVNHLDTAASYGDFELRIASWLKRHSEEFFVATKTDKRDYKGAKEDLHRSLERLGVDHIDLLQLHNLVVVIEWEFALREGGALEAAVEAREDAWSASSGSRGMGSRSRVLGREGVCLNTAGDVNLLPHVLAAAEGFSGDRPGDETMRDLVRRHSLKPLFV